MDGELYPVVGLPIDAILNHIMEMYEYKNIYVKIDVEGFELNVLNGMINALKRNIINELFVEMGASRTLGETDKNSGHEQIYIIMESFNYRPLYLRDASGVYDQHFILH
ncbi:FkbM family methyltransferase [Methylocystis sp. ATCC 49242]|uniref:FkbM family methyltransferase n=1 Tax=Methylocystis sp. ATCC 49242 TaxID=622637 RepID=UPI0001F86D7B|nr:FkbM family methyltransferase [Methylocystis sp. ATCC 49242]